MKICTKCKEELPATTEYFHKSNKTKSGIRGDCKKCAKEYNTHNKEKLNNYFKEYYQENKDKKLKQNKEYRDKNREEILKQRKQYRENNKESKAITDKRYYIENKEQILSYHKRYREENKNKISMWFENNKNHRQEYRKTYRIKNKFELTKYMKEYRKLNIEKLKIQKQERYCKLRNLEYGLTVEQWREIKTDFNNQCAYCGLTEKEHLERFKERLHQEHFIPLNYNGEYTHNNIIPACRSCNSSKSDKDFFEWYSTHEHYDEKREKFILEYLGYIENAQQLSIL